MEDDRLSTSTKAILWFIFLLFVTIVTIFTVYKIGELNTEKKYRNAIKEIHLPTNYKLVGTQYSNHHCLDVCPYIIATYEWQGSIPDNEDANDFDSEGKYVDDAPSPRSVAIMNVLKRLGYKPIDEWGNVMSRSSDGLSVTVNPDPDNPEIKIE